MTRACLTEGAHPTEESLPIFLGRIRGWKDSEGVALIELAVLNKAGPCDTRARPAHPLSRRHRHPPFPSLLLYDLLPRDFQTAAQSLSDQELPTCPIPMIMSEDRQRCTSVAL